MAGTSTLQPPILNTHSLEWYSYISLKKLLREFFKDQSISPLGDHFVNFNNLCIDIVKIVVGQSWDSQG